MGVRRPFPTGKKLTICLIINKNILFFSKMSKNVLFGAGQSPLPLRTPKVGLILRVSQRKKKIKKPITVGIFKKIAVKLKKTS
jgi:hypothetical protein